MFHKTFANSSSPNTKLSRTELSKMVNFGGFLPVFSRLMNPEKLYGNMGKTLDGNKDIAVSSIHLSEKIKEK